ncbi:ankyrin repeat-containing domain protein [Xylaria telfairii]|nr:ankyrin repeat-containing domain protein [Xylaria telfairii]
MSLQDSGTSYWQKAYDSLSPELQANFQHAEIGNRDVLEAVLKTAEQKREICLRRKWRFTLPIGQVVIVREVVEKITSWIQSFIAAGDLATQHDTSSAALPWAAVCFLLRISISDTQVESDVALDLETVSRLIARYHEFERTHLQHNSTVRPQIEEYLIRLYADILSFLAVAIGFYDSKTWSAKNEFKVLSINHSHKILNREAGLLEVAGLSDSDKLYYTEDPDTRGLIEETGVSDKDLGEAKQLLLAQWLSKVPVSANHALKSEERMLDSAKWLLDHREYRSWKDSRSSAALLLHGIAGSGKSMICSAVIDSYLNDQASNYQTARVAYFYCVDCKFEPERSKPVEILRSILKQLAIDQSRQNVVPDFIRSEFDRRVVQSNVDGLDVQKLCIQDCVKLIQQVTIECPVTIIIDALDQIEEYSRPSLMEALGQIMTGSLNVVKVFLTNRNDSSLFAFLSEDPEKCPMLGNADVQKIRVSREDTRSDMEAYVKLQLSIMESGRQLLKGDVSPRLSQFLVDKLVDGAGEMFQWVNIQLRHLCHQDREEDIIEILDKRKFATLDGIYAAVLESILEKGGISCDIAFRTFSWLLFMQEPVSSQSLLLLVSKQILPVGAKLQSSDLVDICSSFVLLDEKRDTFRFSHQSVQEFMRKHERLSVEAANLLLANSCIQFCIEGPLIDNAGENNPSNAVYRYAAMYWPHHASLVHEKQNHNALTANVLSFIYDGPNRVSLSFMAWMDQVEGITGTISTDHLLEATQGAIPNLEYSPLFLASIFGLVELIEAIAENLGDQSWDLVNHYGHTSLYLACASGHVSVARALITHGANPNVRCGRFGSCLQAACFKGHTAIVSLLLAQGAPIYQPGTFSNALQAAFRGQQEEVMLLLLQQESAIRDQEDYLQAIGGAAQSGFLQVLEQLETSPLASRHNTQANDMKFKTMKAIRGGQQGVLTRFLKSVPDPAAILPKEAVSLAAVYGHDAVIKLLANIGISLEGDNVLGAPLRCASLMNRESTVRLLINLGADVNMLGPYGTALQAASMNGHARIAKLLLTEGAELNQQGGVYGTALQAAAYHGHRAIVNLLLEPNSSRTLLGLAKDAFCAAVEGGHHDIVQHILGRGLLDKGSEYKMANMTSCTLRSTYNSLLRKSSPSRTSSGRESKRKTSSPSWSIETVYKQPSTDHQDILAAMGEMGISNSSGGSTKNLKFLRSQNESREDSDSSDCPLATCAEIGNIVAVSAVLDRKRKLGLGHKDIVRALNAAASNGHAVIIGQLLQHIPGSLSVADGFEALKSAISSCDLEGINLLLKHIDSSGWDEKCHQKLVTRACQANIAIIEVIVPYVRTLTSAEDVNRLLEVAFPRIAKKGKDEGKVDVIDWICKQIGNASQSHYRDIFEIACNRGLRSTAVRTLQIASNNGIDREDILKGTTVCASEGHIELLAVLSGILLSEGEKVNYAELLQLACTRGHLPVVNWLLNQPHQLLDLTKGLVIASSNGHIQVVLALLEAGADINAAVAVSTTDLNEQYARFFYHKGEDKVFSALQAALNRVAHFESPLSFTTTADVDRVEHVIRVLLDRNVDVNSIGDDSIVPLHVAARDGSPRVVRWLIDAGANVNAEVDENNSLISAARRELLSFEIFQILLDSGAQLPSSTESLSRIFDVTLRHFDTGKSHGPPGRSGDLSEHLFQNTDSLHDVFTTGPGAVLRFLLEKTGWKKSYPHFSIILQMVCILGDGGYVDLLLERDADVNAVCSYYGTALQAAARHGHAHLVQRLLEAGADPNIIAGEHYTALRAAVKGSHSGAVQALLLFGADVHLPSPSSTSAKEKRSSLDLAIKLGNEEITSMLLNAGADANLSGEEQQHALILACGTGDLKTARHLLFTGARPDIVTVADSWGIDGTSSREMTPLHRCCFHGSEEIMRLLLDKSPNLEVQIQYSQTPLIIAARQGFSGIIRLLVAAGADIKHKGPYFGTALSAAAEKGHLDAVRALLEIGAPVYDPVLEISAFKCAWRTDSIPVLKLLAEAAVSVPDGKLAITQAIKQWCNWLISDLLHQWSEPHLRLLIDYTGPTTEGLLAACAFGSVSIVEDMLNSGVSANEGNISGSGALSLAARFLHPDIVQVLLDHGANIHDQSPESGSILNTAMLGCVRKLLPGEANPGKELRINVAGFQWKSWGSEQESNCERIVKLLVDRGIEITDTPFMFGTGLHLACFMGNEFIITTLLSKGLDANSNAGYFQNPLFAAIHQNHDKAVELLLSNSADPNSCHPTFGPALSYAYQKEGVRIIELLLLHGADPNMKGTLEHSLIVDIMVDGPRFWRKSPLSPLHRAQLVTQILSHGQLKICNGDLVAVAESELSIDGRSPVEILLEQDSQLIVSEETITSLLKSLGTDRYRRDFLHHDAVLKLYLSRSSDQGVTKAMLQEARTLDQMNILLAHQPRCPITLEIVEAQKGKELMALLLELEPNMASTQAMVTQALKYERRYDNMQKEKIVDLLEELWRRNPELTVTDDMIEATATLDPETLQFLLSHSPADLRLSQGIFVTVVSRRRSSKELLRLLLQHQPDVEEETVAKALETAVSRETATALDVFLENNPAMAISERIFLAALHAHKGFGNAYNRGQAFDRAKDLAELLKKHGKRVVITDAMRETIDEVFQGTELAADKELFYSAVTA